MIKNRLFLALTILVVCELASANENNNNNNKAAPEKKNPIINLFEAPLKAFQTKPGEAIAVFQPEIVRQTEGNENQTSSWFQAGQSLGSQVSSLTGWLTNRLTNNQQSSTTPKPDSEDPDILVQVQQIKPNQNNDIRENNRQPPKIKVIRMGQNKNMVRLNRAPVKNAPPPLSHQEFVEALEDIAEQQRLENEQFDDAEDDYDDELEHIETEEENIPIVINSILANNKPRPNTNRLRQSMRVNSNVDRRPSSGMRQQNEKRRRTVQIRRKSNPNRRLIFHTQSVQPVSKKQNFKRINMVSSSKRGFNDNNSFSDEDDYNDNETDEEDYNDEDDNNDSDNNENENSDDSEHEEESEDYNEEDGDENDQSDSSDSKNKKGQEYYEDDDSFIDLQDFEPLEIRPQSGLHPVVGFRPIEHVTITGNGHIDRITQMNQQFPTNAIKRRQQLIQLQQKRKREREREQQKLQQALLSNQHIVIPIHFIPDSIPYSEIVPQVQPQAQIQVVAQHHHTVENTGPITSILDDDDDVPNRNPNRNRNKNNRRPVNNRNRVTILNQSSNQQRRKNQNQRISRTTTQKPNRNDDVFYSVNLIAPGPATSGRGSTTTTRATRRPATRRSTPRSSTTPKRQSAMDGFRGESTIAGAKLDKNRPDATPQSSDSDEVQETPAQYVAPAPSLSEDEDDDDDVKPQARTQFYLPQNFYQILGSDKYLSVGNNGRFLLKSARSLDLQNPVSEIEHVAKVVETSDNKSEEKSGASIAKEIEDINLKQSDPIVASKEAVEIPTEKVEKSESLENLKSVESELVENPKITAPSEKEIDDGSVSTTTERPFVVHEQNEEQKSSTVAPPVNKVAKVLLRSEIVQEKQNGGRFLVKSEEVKI